MWRFGWIKYGGTISNSYASGSVNGNNYVGGLVGWEFYAGTISNSYATGTVSGTIVGGLVGYNIGTISNSYASGTVMEFYVEVGWILIIWNNLNSFYDKEQYSFLMIVFGKQKQKFNCI